MASNYDNSAPFYDQLARIVFGDALVKAQVYFLPRIAAGSTVLIIGGGTGWILEELTKVHASGLAIVYVEISSRMMALSRRRNIGTNRVTFINKAIEDIGPLPAFDVVITPFLFDNYQQEALNAVVGHIHTMLKTGGLWLNTDFQLTGKWWQYALLKSMLLFFKLLCGVESWRLPAVQQVFVAYNYSLIEEKTFFKEFVVTKILKRQ